MDSDQIVFGVGILGTCLAVWAALCKDSIRKKQLTIAELLALVFLIGYSFALASWL